MKKKNKLILTLVMCITLLCSISAPAMAVSIDYFYSTPTGDINLGQSKCFWWKVSDLDFGSYQYKFVGWDGQQSYVLKDWTTCSEDDYAWAFYPQTRGNWEVDIFIRDSYSIYEDDFFTVR